MSDQVRSFFWVATRRKLTTPCNSSLCLFNLHGSSPFAKFPYRAREWNGATSAAALVCGRSVGRWYHGGMIRTWESTAFERRDLAGRFSPRHSACLHRIRARSCPSTGVNGPGRLADRMPSARGHESGGCQDGDWGPGCPFQGVGCDPGPSRCESWYLGLASRFRRRMPKV